MHRDQMPRLAPARLDLLPQPRHVRVDRARERGAVVAPDVIEQRLAADDFVRVVDEVAQDAELARRELERRAAPSVAW